MTTNLHTAKSYVANGALDWAEQALGTISDETKRSEVADEITSAVESWAEADPSGTNDRAAEELDSQIYRLLDDAGASISYPKDNQRR